MTRVVVWRALTIYPLYIIILINTSSDSHQPIRRQSHSGFDVHLNGQGSKNATSYATSWRGFKLPSDWGPAG